MALLKSRSLTVSINLDPKTVYEFIFNLENLFKWASKAFQSIKQVKGEWIAETAQGNDKNKYLPRKTILEFSIIM